MRVAGKPAAEHNWDHPNALDTELLADHLRALKAGETIRVPQYDFALVGHTRSHRERWRQLVETYLLFFDWASHFWHCFFTIRAASLCDQLFFLPWAVHSS